MAQKVTILLVDDLDGSDAAETVSFGLDGTTYEIDLSEENAMQLRSTMEAYTMAARTANGTRRRKPRGTRQLTSIPTPEQVTAAVPERVGPHPSVVRAWAKENGVPVGDKGRVAQSVVRAYEEAMEQKAS